MKRERGLRPAAALVALWLVGGAGIAAGVGERYPQGSIQTIEQAERALQEARDEHAQIERAYEAEKRACLSRFFVTRCEDQAKRKRDAARHQLRRVELEARDRQRRIEAQQRAEERAERQASEADGGPRESRAAPETETRPAGGRSPQEAAARRRAYEARIAEHERERKEKAARAAAEDAQRAANVKRLEERRRQAAEHAKEKEAERIQNQKRREERRKALERRKAEEGK
jgi:hypothetical protein